MRTSLLHPITAWRHHEPALDAPTTSGGSRSKPTRPEERLTRPEEHVAAPTPDIAVRRSRDAGGPVDEACYPCSCGCFFIAPVSTHVRCPHCGASQAW